jgi:protein-tyrosine phosphatase
VNTLENSHCRILFVCLGNICRSPTAEGVLRHLAPEAAPELRIEVDSAGTGDYHIGDPPDLRSQRAAERRGIDLSNLRARQIEAADFTRFDLILAMDRQNLRALEAMRPSGSKVRPELFLEFAGQPGPVEVPDPYMGDSADFERVLDLISAACSRLIAVLKKRA